MPRKRFTKEAVLEKPQEYLGTGASYAQVVRHGRMPILYDDCTPAGQQQVRGLASSSVWRWLSWLGGLERTLRGACALIRQKQPNSTFHRETWALPPQKYRSPARQEVLQRAMQLIAANRLFVGAFGREIFPGFATGWGWS